MKASEQKIAMSVANSEIFEGEDNHKSSLAATFDQHANLGRHFHEKQIGFLMIQPGNEINSWVTRRTRL